MDNIIVVRCICMGWSKASMGTEDTGRKMRLRDRTKKEYQGQDSSIAVLNTRRRKCYRIKLVRDGAGGNREHSLGC